MDKVTDVNEQRESVSNLIKRFDRSNEIINAKPIVTAKPLNHNTKATVCETTIIKSNQQVNTSVCNDFYNSNSRNVFSTETITTTHKREQSVNHHQMPNINERGNKQKLLVEKDDLLAESVDNSKSYDNKISLSKRVQNSTSSHSQARPMSRQHSQTSQKIIHNNDTIISSSSTSSNTKNYQNTPIISSNGFSNPNLQINTSRRQNKPQTALTLYHDNNTIDLYSPLQDFENENIDFERNFQNISNKINQEHRALIEEHNQMHESMKLHMKRMRMKFVDDEDEF